MGVRMKVCGCEDDEGVRMMKVCGCEGDEGVWV